MVTGPAGVLARTWLRRNVAATLLLVVLVALTVGATAGTVAGARRSSSALDRFIEHNRPPTLQVYGDGLDVEAVRALPQVVGAGTGAYGLMTVRGPGGEPVPPGVVNPFITMSNTGERLFRPLVVDGAEPDWSSPDLVTIDEAASDRLGAAVGDRLVLRFYSPDQLEELYDFGGEFPPPRGREVAVSVAGIVRHPFDLNRIEAADIDAVSLASADLHLSPGFWAAYGDDVAAFGADGGGVEVLLRNGAADVPAVREALRAMPGGDRFAIEARNDSLDAIADLRETVRIEALALAVAGGLAALVGSVLVGQLIAQQLRHELAQRTVLTGIGLTSRDLARAAVLRTVPVGAGGALLGVLVGWFGSRMTPVGYSRRAEVDPGMAFDPLVMLLVPFAAAVLAVIWAARVASRPGSSVRSTGAAGWGGRLAARAAVSGAPVSVVTGLSHLTGVARGGVRTPLRSALGAVVFACGVAVGVVVFATSLARFVDEPAEHGWAWDAIVGDTDDPDLATSGRSFLDEHRSVAGFAAASIGFEDIVQIPEVGDVGVVALESVRGDTYVPLLHGRAATGEQDIVLGSETMRRAGVGIGDQIVVDGPGGPVSFLVVGQAVLHELVAPNVELDEGAVTSPAGLARIFGSDGVMVGRYLVELEPDTPLATVDAEMREEFGPTLIPHLPPLDVASLDAVRVVPVGFAMLVGLLGAGSLVHLLLATVRRRRHEFAVLSALGADARQRRLAVVSFATAVALTAVIAGLPFGLLAGRLAWLAVASSIGSPTAPVVPGLVLAGAAVLVVLVANLVAAAPARLAARVRPGGVLRTE